MDSLGTRLVKNNMYGLGTRLVNITCYNNKGGLHGGTVALRFESERNYFPEVGNIHKYQRCLITGSDAWCQGRQMNANDTLAEMMKRSLDL